VTVALAGCLGGGNGSSDTNNVDTSGPEAVVETYYQRLNQAQGGTPTDEAVETMEPVIWEESTFVLRSLREGFEADRIEIAANLASVETTVTDENFGVERLTELGFNDIFSESEIATIAEENANVEATVEYTDEREDRTEDLHITAKINDDWLITTVGQ
jgi:hypothetical protein